MRSPNLAFGPFLFDPNSRLLSRAGVELPLPPRVVGVLEVLLRRAGDVVPRQELIESVWKDAFVTDTSLAEAVSALRQALGDDAQTPVYVQTLHRRGYRFVAPVAPIAERAAVVDVAAAAPEAPAPAPVRPSIGGALVPWSIAALCAVAAVAAVWNAVSGRDAAEPPVARFAIETVTGTTLDDSAPAIAIAPDGTAVAWSGCDERACRVYVRHLDRLQPAAIAGSDGAAAPFFSPDGRWIGFFADGKLKKAALTGGAPIVLADAPDPLGAVWLPRGGILYAGSAFAGLSRVDDNGGTPAVATVPRVRDGEVGHAWPALSADGTLLLFTVLDSPDAADGRLAAMPLEALGGSSWKVLADGIGVPAGVADGALLFSRGGELQATWIDRQRLVLGGESPAALAAVARPGRGAQLALSRSGALLVAAPSGSTTISLARVSQGQASSGAELDRALGSLTLSPDGRRVAGVETGHAPADVWVADVARGTTTRVTHGGENASPVWSGSALLYAARADGVSRIFRKEADGGAPAVELFSGAAPAYPAAATADGSMLAFVQSGEGGRCDLWLLPLRGGPAVPLLRTPFDERAPAFSPDGGFVAYQSTESGRWEIYVMRRSDGRRIIVSRAGGTAPAWTPDGSQIVYRSGREVLRAAFDGRGDLRVDAPQRLLGDDAGVPIGIAPDGALVVRRRPARPASMTLALAWTRELRPLLGPPPAFVPR